MKRVFVSAAVCAVTSLLATGWAFAQEGGTSCPDTRASEVPVEVSTGGLIFNCRGASFNIDGVTISTGASTCTQHVIIVPAHQICEGIPLEGHRCVFEDTVPIQVHWFECRAEYWLLGIFGASVRCTAVLDANGGHKVTVGGSIEDFKTEDCPELAPDLDEVGPDPGSGSGSGDSGSDG
jgi:hypothetical protein